MYQELHRFSWGELRGREKSAFVTVAALVGAASIYAVFAWRITRATPPANLPAITAELHSPPTPTNSGAVLSPTPTPRLIGIDALVCEGGIQAISDANLGAFKRKRPNIESDIDGIIPAGQTITVEDIAKVRQSDGKRSYWAQIIDRVPEQISRDGTVIRYAEIGPSNNDRAGLGTNADLDAICKLASDTPWSKP